MSRNCCADACRIESQQELNFFDKRDSTEIRRKIPSSTPAFGRLEPTGRFFLYNLLAKDFISSCP